MHTIVLCGWENFRYAVWNSLAQRGGGGSAYISGEIIDTSVTSSCKPGQASVCLWQINHILQILAERHVFVHTHAPIIWMDGREAYVSPCNWAPQLISLVSVCAECLHAPPHIWAGLYACTKIESNKGRPERALRVVYINITHPGRTHVRACSGLAAQQRAAYATDAHTQAHNSTQHIHLVAHGSSKLFIKHPSSSSRIHELKQANWPFKYLATSPQWRCVAASGCVCVVYVLLCVCVCLCMCANTKWAQLNQTWGRPNSEHAKMFYMYSAYRVTSSFEAKQVNRLLGTQWISCALHCASEHILDGKFVWRDGVFCVNEMNSNRSTKYLNL